MSEKYETPWYARGDEGEAILSLVEYYIYGAGTYGPDGAPNWGQLQASLYERGLSMSEVWDVMNDLREGAV